MSPRLARRGRRRRRSRSPYRDPWRRALVLEALEDRVLLSDGLLPGLEPDEPDPLASASESPIDPVLTESSSDDPVEPDGTTAEIRGTIWDDLNADGVWDTDEPGLDSRTVFIDQDGDGRVDTGEPVTVTDAEGNYAFTGLAPGTYNVQVEVAPERWQTSPGFFGEEFRVALETHSGQQYPDVAMDPAGNYVITWWDYNDWDIMARRYSADGTPQGQAITVNEADATYGHRDPRVAMFSSGDFVITWEGRGLDGSHEGIGARWYHADGTPKTSVTLVNESPYGGQLRPMVSVNEAD